MDEAGAVPNVTAVEADNASNLTGREAATTEGMIITYSALFAMALGPIIVGALRSVPYHISMKVERERLIRDTPDVIVILI